MPLYDDFKVLVKEIIGFLFFFFKLKRTKFFQVNPQNVEVILDPSLGIGDIIMVADSIGELIQTFPNLKIFSGMDNIFCEEVNWYKFSKDNFKEVFEEYHDPNSFIFIPRISYFLILKLFFRELKAGISCQVQLKNFFSSSKDNLQRYRSDNYIIMAKEQLLSFLNEKESALNKRLSLKEEPYLIEGEYIVIAPSAHENIRKLEDRQWNKICKHFKDKGSIILVGSEKDKESNSVLFDKIENQQKNVFNLTGHTSFYQLVSIIKNSKLLISIDNGPFHVGRYLGKKTIAFFGPTDPKTRSIQEENIIFGHEKNLCPKNISPCNKFVKGQTCPTNKECLYNQDIDRLFSTLFNEGQENREIFN